jgi:hypothetical protein
MASSYDNDLRLNEMATGDGSGTWGDTTNTNLALIAEAFSYGTEVITTNADTHTTTIADGATDPGRSLYLKYTGTLDSACTITIAPNDISKVWIIENGTSGSQNIIISQGSGATITIPAGDTKVVYSDGAGAGAAFFDAFASINVGALTGTSLDISGDIDVDGTANLDVVDIDGAVDFASTTAHAGNATFADNAKAIFGAGSDLQIYHDGSNSYVKDAGVGDLIIQAYDDIKFQQSTDNEDLVTINTGGNVTIHGGNLDVTGSVTADGLTVDGVATVTGTNLTINSSASTPYIGFSENGTTGLLIGESSIIGAGGGYDIYAAAGQGLTFFTNASRAVDIDTSGNVGIGTASPLAKNHITGSGTSGQVTASWILQNNSSGTAGMDITGSAGASRLRFVYGGGPGTGTNSLTEAMSMGTEGTYAGRVGIGTSSPSETLEVNSRAKIGNITLAGNATLSTLSAGNANFEISTLTHTGGAGGLDFDIFLAITGGIQRVFQVEASGTGDTYTNDGTVSSLSDERVKTDIQDLTDGLEIVKQLRPVTFKYNDTSTNEKGHKLMGGAGDKVRYGFIAQEVEAVAPQYVEYSTRKINNEEVNDFRNLSTTRMLPMLFKAVQEQQVLIEQLQAEVALLKG